MPPRHRAAQEWAVFSSAPPLWEEVSASALSVLVQQVAR